MATTNAVKDPKNGVISCWVCTGDIDRCASFDDASSQTRNCRLDFSGVDRDMDRDLRV